MYENVDFWNYGLYSSNKKIAVNILIYNVFFLFYVLIYAVYRSLSYPSLIPVIISV